MKRYSISTPYTLELQGEARYCFLPVIDSMEPGCRWGRLHIDMRLPSNGICHVYAAAKDEDEQPNFRKEGRNVGTNCSDMLLFQEQGRYLWICVELLGCGRAGLKDIYVVRPGTELLLIFPEVYQEHGTFLERYLAIFSTLYEQMQEKIEGSEGLLDCRKADRSLVRRYLGWMGLGSLKAGLTEDEERRLLTDLYWLNRRKGTRAAAFKLAELLLGQGPIIMEARGRELWMIFREEKREDEKQKFMAVLKEFLPAGMKANLVCGKQVACCDSHAYLDLNGAIYEHPEGTVDRGQAVGMCALGES